MKVSMLWYFYPGAQHFPIPEALKSLVEHDNRTVQNENKAQ
jgi:hypothetical protein